jgi:peptide/nickel transport system substrate-binding protein
MMGVMTMVSTNTPMGERTREPVGTGPYTFAEWTVGERLVLKRFDGYWGEQPPVEQANYIWRTESAVRAAMVQTGEADIAPNIAVQDATDENLDFSYPNSETSRLRIDTLTPPLNDRRVREALNLALDREAMVGTIFSADVQPATQLVVPSINGYNPELKVWPYDAEKAMALLDAARADGVPVDSEITLIGRINIYPNATEAAEAILAMYQAVGLNVKLQMLEVAEWVDLLTKPFAEDRGPAIQQSQHDNNNGDAVFTVFNKYHSDGGQSMVMNAELDDVIVRAGQATGDERRQLFQQAFKIINDDIIADVPMFHMVGYSRVSSRLNFQPDISTNSEMQISRITFK